MKRIGIDFQGWPINAMTLKEILDKISTKSEDMEDNMTNYCFDRKVLDSYVRILEDDGMGYGVNPRYIICADNNPYEDSEIKENVINMFGEPIDKDNCKSYE